MFSDDTKRFVTVNSDDGIWEKEKNLYRTHLLHDVKKSNLLYISIVKSDVDRIYSKCFIKQIYTRVECITRYYYNSVVLHIYTSKILAR